MKIDLKKTNRKRSAKKAPKAPKVSSSGKASTRTPAAQLSLPSSSKITAATRAATRTTHATLCGLADPFCAHARGSKYPDVSSVRTLSFTAHTRYPFPTDASGDGSILFTPAWIYPAYLGVCTGSSVVFTTAIASSWSASMNPDTYRITSMGIRVRCLSAPLTTSGMLYIRGFAAVGGTNLNNVDMTSYNADFSSDVPVSAINASGSTDVIFSRQSMIAQNFRNPSSTNSNSSLVSWLSPGFGPVLVSILGGPLSANVLDIEIFVHYELTFTDENALQLLATPPATPNPTLAAAATHINNKVGNVFTEIGNRVGPAIEKAASAAMTAMTEAAFVALVL